MRSSLILSILVCTSCATNAGTAAFTGALLGAGTGQLIGGEKAGFIASAAGILTGGVIGAVLDRQDRLIMQKNSPRTVDRIDQKAPLTINDVIKLSQNGVSDDTIISYLNDTLSFYSLSKTQIKRLQHSGVSQQVINTMIWSGR